MNHISDYSIRENLPKSLERENAKELAELTDEISYKYNLKIAQVLIYPVIDKLDSDLINALAIQLHCDYYEKSLSLEDRRTLVKNSIAWHRIKGTPAVVEEVVSTVFARGRIAEWFEYGGDPYYFRIYVSGFQSEIDDNLDRLVHVVESVKNVRSWLESFIIDLNPFKDEPGNQYHAYIGHVRGRVGDASITADTSIVEDPDAFTGKVGLFRAGRSHAGMP